MKEFKIEVVDELIERHEARLGQTTCQHVRRLVQRGAENLDAYALMDMCRELQCLPTDIVRMT